MGIRDMWFIKIKVTFRGKSTETEASKINLTSLLNQKMHVHTHCIKIDMSTVYSSPIHMCVL
jgi:hypothetical protein